MTMSFELAPRAGSATPKKIKKISYLLVIMLQNNSKLPPISSALLLKELIGFRFIFISEINNKYRYSIVEVNLGKYVTTKL